MILLFCQRETVASCRSDYILETLYIFGGVVSLDEQQVVLQPLPDAAQTESEMSCRYINTRLFYVRKTVKICDFYF